MRRLNRRAEAITSRDGASVVRRNETEHLQDRGNALPAGKRFDDVVKNCNKVLAVHPKDVSALHNRGIALRCLGRLREALASHDRALAIRTHDPEGLTIRGGVLLELMRFGEPTAITRNLPLLMKGKSAGVPADIAWVRPAIKSVSAGPVPR